MSLRDDLIKKLEEENEDLRARVRELEQQLGISVGPPLAFGLSRQEGVIFGLLVKNPLVTREFAMSTLYLHEQDMADDKILDVFICKVRRKLQPWNIDILTKWGQGWFMPSESRVKARGLMEQLQ